MVGRRRWVERMRLAKAQGLIARFPSGGNSRVRVRSPDPRSARLEREAEKAIEAMLASLPVVPDKPVEEMSVDELRAEVTRSALAFHLDVLRRPIDEPGMSELKREIALATPQLPRPRKRRPK